MENFEVVIEVLKYGGVQALFFMFLVLYHNAQRKADKDSHEANVEILKQIIEEQRKREDRHFSFLQEMIEQQSFMAASLARVEQKIDTNHFCPIVRDRSGGNR